MKTKTYRHGTKRWKLPKFVRFEGLSHSSGKYEVLGFRPPKKGEYYLSGSQPMAYKAPNNLSYKFLVVEPIEAD